MVSKKISLFATHTVQGVLAQHQDLNRQLLEDIQEVRRSDRVGKVWSQENYKGGYTSYASLSDLHRRTRAFARLEDLLQPEAKHFAKLQKWNLKGLRLEMTHCWANIMPRHTYHPLHLHPHSVVSGAYYLQTPTKSVALKLEDPRMPLYMHAPPREGVHAELYHLIHPRAGSFVLFESWLRHEVPPNQSRAPRISISFNYSLEVTED